jgi:sulfide:quinone oxidoreductase
VSQTHYTVAIVGGGSGGIAVAARLARAAKGLYGKIAILDPAEKHYYQPLWTLVGGGVARKEATERKMSALIPEGVDWLQDSVTDILPEENLLVTAKGMSVRYDYLVVAAGIHVAWEKIKGLRETLGKNGVCSNYSYDLVDSTWENIRDFSGGNAIFTQPNTPVKCGGAPQKIMYLAEEFFCKKAIRQHCQVIFASASPTIFAVKKYAATLDQVILRKQIITKFKRNLIEIKPDAKEAVFEHVETGELEVLPYSMIHVVPPMHAPPFIQKSPIADQAGWVDVDKYTLQHKRFADVFALGDCSNLPTSKTGAAIRKQAPVVAGNLLARMEGKPLPEKYDGYTSCPLVTGYGNLVLAEFDYDLNPRETFWFDQSKERYSMYLLKKHVLPVMYWQGMMKGRM